MDILQKSVAFSIMALLIAGGVSVLVFFVLFGVNILDRKVRMTTIRRSSFSLHFLHFFFLQEQPPQEDARNRKRRSLLHKSPSGLRTRRIFDVSSLDTPLRSDVQFEPVGVTSPPPAIVFDDEEDDEEDDFDINQEILADSSLTERMTYSR